TGQARPLLLATSCVIAAPHGRALLVARNSLQVRSGATAGDERTEADVADRPICSPGEDVRNGSGRLERNRTLMGAPTRRVKSPCHWGDLRGSLLPVH